MMKQPLGNVDLKGTARSNWLNSVVTQHSTHTTAVQHSAVNRQYHLENTKAFLPLFSYSLIKHYFNPYCNLIRVAVSHLQACNHHFVSAWLLDFLQWIVIYRFRNIQAQALPGLISGVSLVSGSWQCCCYDIMLLASKKTSQHGWFKNYRCSEKPCVNCIFGSEMRVCVCKNAFSHMC